MEFETELYKKAQQTQKNIYELEQQEDKQHEKIKSDIYFRYRDLEN